MLDEKKDLFYEKDKWYAITIAPDDRLQWFKDKKRYNHFYEYYRKLLIDLFDAKHYEYYFRIEASEPRGEIQSSGPRLHLHGYLKMKSKSAVFQLLVHALCQLLEHSRLEVTICNDVTAWWDYIHKQEMYMPIESWISNYDEPETFYQKGLMQIKEEDKPNRQCAKGSQNLRAVDTGELLERSSEIPGAKADEVRPVATDNSPTSPIGTSCEVAVMKTGRKYKIKK